jgi:E3 ubiquitin-protein ligase HUWE1
MFGLLEDLPKQTETPSRSVADALLGVLGGGIPAAAPAPFVLNESYVDTLAEMGFTRYAATHALTRLRNNLPAATEYLLSHAHLIEEPPAVPAAPAPAPADTAPDAPLPETEQADNPAGQHQAENADVEMSAAVTPSGPSDVDEEPVVEEDPEEVKKRLAELCAEVKPSVPARSLALVDSHDGLVFDVGSVFLQVESGLQTILNSLRAAKPAEQGPDGEQCLASRLRLLAVILNANDAGSKFTDDLRSEFMDTISSLPHADAEHRYQWIAAQFLCAQALFRLADGIQKVDVGSPMPDSIFTGPSFDTARKSFFASSLALLRSGECSPEELSAALRLLVSLTRDRALACQLLENGQVQLLFDIIQRTPRKEAGNCLGFVNMIIRHIVEDDETLQASIQREIRAWFNKPRSKVVDVAHFVSNIRPVALRDPEIFLRAVEQECALVTPEPPRSGPFHIQSKDAVRSAPAVRKGADHPMEQAQPADDPFKIVPLPVAVKTNRDQLIQHLTTELQSILSKAQSETSEAKLDEAASREDMRAVAEDTALYHRVCALLLSLTELLGSYTACKSAFITQGGAKLSGKDTGLQSGRGRVSMVSYLLNNFICNLSFDTDVARSDGQALTSSQRRWLNISNWASSAIVALCADTGSGGTLKDIPSELVAVRKSVLDTIIKAIKDVGSSSENINLRYGRLWALSELSYRLLTAKASVQTRHRDETAIHLAKIMLEKGFVTTLTNTLTEVDLNFPNVKVLISAILQPLEYL